MITLKDEQVNFSSKCKLTRCSASLTLTVTVVSLGLLYYFEGFPAVLGQVGEQHQQKEVMAEDHRYVTVFEKIINNQAPATKLHEDDMCMAIKSNNPLAPVHFLVLPKKTISTLSDIGAEDQMLMGHMMLIASQVAKQEKVDGFYRVVINNDDTTIPYLHIHVLGGRRMGWPPG